MRDIKEWLTPIGERIRQARKELNISQTELAERADISVPYLSKIEMGKSDFGVSVLIRISEALQISTDKLLRPDIPETTVIAADDLSKVLEGCTPNETASIIDTARNMRKAFIEARNTNI